MASDWTLNCSFLNKAAGLNIELLCHTCLCVIQPAQATRQAWSQLIWNEVFYFKYFSLTVWPGLSQIISWNPSSAWWPIGANRTSTFFMFSIWRRFHRLILVLFVLGTMLFSMLLTCLLKWSCCALWQRPYGIMKCWHFVCSMKNCLNSSFSAGRKLYPLPFILPTRCAFRHFSASLTTYSYSKSHTDGLLISVV